MNILMQIHLSSFFDGVIYWYSFNPCRWLHYLKDPWPLTPFSRALKLNEMPMDSYLSHSEYIDELLSCSKKENARSHRTSMSTSKSLSLHYGDPMPYPTLYHSTVRALQYMTVTRPDISYNVTHSSLFFLQNTNDAVIGKLANELFIILKELLLMISISFHRLNSTLWDSLLGMFFWNPYLGTWYILFHLLLLCGFFSWKFSVWD